MKSSTNNGLSWFLNCQSPCSLIIVASPSCCLPRFAFNISFPLKKWSDGSKELAASLSSILDHKGRRRKIERFISNRSWDNRLPNRETVHIFSSRLLVQFRDLIFSTKSIFIAYWFVLWNKSLYFKHFYLWWYFNSSVFSAEQNSRRMEKGKT